MIPPGVKCIIDIDVTNRCSIARCSNCTRGLLYQAKRWDMTPENFRLAVRSLREWTELAPVRGRAYSGRRVIAVIGGNPCMSRYFEDYCRIIREEIPRKEARGLWTENLKGYGSLARETFGSFNLNAHGNAQAAAEMHRELPERNVWGAAPHRTRNMHGAVLMAIQDFVGSAAVPTEAAMWKRIEDCDVNKNWSGTIMPFDLPDGSQVIRAYFCEIAAVLERIAASQDEAQGSDNFGPKTGVPVTVGWWKMGMNEPGFADQHKSLCPRCGVSLRVEGHFDQENTDDFSPTYEPLVKIASRRKQHARLHEQVPEHRARELTDYQRWRDSDKPRAWVRNPKKAVRILLEPIRTRLGLLDAYLQWYRARSKGLS